MRAAVIGIGSNSVRMLLADIHGSHLSRLMRDREGTRLFAGLDARRALSQEAMERVGEAVRRMAASARENGAEQLHLFSTSAVRDASNQAAFIHLLRECAGVEMEVCSGEEEAALSFLGATEGELCGVIDIGGGSTEVVVGKEKDIWRAFSCQMGAVRLFQRLPINSHGDLPAVEKMAAAILEEKLREVPGMAIPDHWVGVGGTFTTLAAMVKGIRWTERTYMHGTLLRLEDIAYQARLLADMPMEQRLNHPGLQPHRADIVVHGICILLAVMKRLGIPSLTVSEYGNLDGYLKDRYQIA